MIKYESTTMAYKPNRIIQAGQQMLPFQQKVFLAALMKLEIKMDKDYKSLSGFYGENNEEYNAEMNRIADTSYKFPIDILFDDFEILRATENSDNVREVKQKLKDIVKQIVVIEEKDKTTAINVVSSATYIHSEKNIYIKFSKDVIPILLDMFREGFTKIRLVSFVRLRSGYSMRIYEELLRVKNMGYVIKNGHTLTLQEIYFMLGIEKHKGYKLYTNFKREVLLRVQKEIVEKTGLSFRFEEIKRGKRIYALKFYDIFEDITKIKKNLNQLSLFDKNEIDTDDILSRINPEEDTISPLLDKIKEIEPENSKTLKAKIQIEIPLQEQIENKEEQKFTDEQQKKLDKYLDGIFSADDIKSGYEFDYIEFYYRKVLEKNDKGTVKDFSGFLYKALTEDKYKYYELREKKKRQEEEKIAKERLERERKKEKEQEEKNKREKEKADQKRWETMFDSLDEEKKKVYLEKLYTINEFYKNLDKTA